MNFDRLCDLRNTRMSVCEKVRLMGAAKATEERAKADTKGEKDAKTMIDRDSGEGLRVWNGNVL